MNLHQMGLAPEVTYGTFVAPTRFLEFLPGESLERRQEILMSEGLRTGLTYKRGQKRALTRQDAGGTMAFEVWNKSFGLLFEHMLGAVVTTQPDSTGSPLVFDHTFTPGDLSSKSMSWQKGVEDDSGTSVPFSYNGVKIESWTIGIDVDGILQLSLDLDSRQEVTSESLAAATYPTDCEFFHFQQGSLEVDDAVIATISTAEITGNNALKNDRYFLSSGGLKLEQREMDFRDISGSLTADFENLTDFYNLFAGDTSAKLELIFAGSVIENTFVDTFHVTMNDVRFTGETPKIEGPDVAVQNVPFEAFDPDSGDVINILYRTADATP